jgi:hypothetical protein
MYKYERCAEISAILGYFAKHSVDSCKISGFRRNVDEVCAVWRHYTAYSGNYLPAFRDRINVSEEGISYLLRGVTLKSLNLIANLWRSTTHVLRRRVLSSIH